MKYELVKTDTKKFGSITLYRIRALIDMRPSVSAGDLGGYIEKESNLAQVYSTAQVFGDAWVYGDARVSGNALIEEQGMKK